MASTSTATTTPTGRREDAASRPADKFDERRNQLAESALQTLGELGYARTSLREIANNSEFSHGVVHYYFHDKIELIVYCVRYYKAHCVRRYDAVVADSTSPEELLDAFAAKLVETLEDEAPMHRLWYDLRTQSMFEERCATPSLMIDHTLEDMIWRVVSRYGELSGAEVAMTPSAAYGMLDGLFQQALLGYLTGDQQATLDTLTGPGARPDAAHPQQLKPGPSSRSRSDGAGGERPRHALPPADAGSAARRSADLRLPAQMASSPSSMIAANGSNSWGAPIPSPAARLTRLPRLSRYTRRPSSS